MTGRVTPDVSFEDIGRLLALLKESRREHHHEDDDQWYCCSACRNSSHELVAGERLQTGFGRDLKEVICWCGATAWNEKVERELENWV